MTDRTGQTWTIAVGSWIETALVVRSAWISERSSAFGDGVTEHSCVALDGRLAGSVVQRYEFGRHWDGVPRDPTSTLEDVHQVGAEFARLA